MFARLKALPIAFAVLVSVVLASAVYASDYWTKTVSGVTLTAQATSVKYCCFHWGGSASSNSTTAIAIAVENYGMETCNFSRFQRWYDSDWQNSSYWADASGSGVYILPWDCTIYQDLSSEGYHLFWYAPYGIDETPFTESVIFYP